MINMVFQIKFRMDLCRIQFMTVRFDWDVRDVLKVLSKDTRN